MGLNAFTNGSLNIESPKLEKEKWAEMTKRLDTPENLKREMYMEKIKVKADAALSRIQEMQDDLNGADAVREAWETLKELYADAVEMRAEMFPDTMRKTLNLAPGADIEEELSKGIEALTDHDGEHQKALGDQLALIASGLAEEPVDTLANQTVQSRYWYRAANGFPDIKQEQVALDEKFLLETEGELKGTQTIKDHPELQQTIDKMKKGIAELKKVNPVMTATYQWQQDNAPKKMDMKPLRMLGIVAGGFFAALGIGYSLYNKKALTWPTFMWAGVAAYSLYPNMFQGKEKDAIVAFKNYNEPGTKKLIAKFNPEAFEELLDVSAEDLKALKTKASDNIKNKLPLTAADIGLVTDGKDTPLSKVLSKMTPGEVILSIDVLAGAAEKDLPVITEMIENL